jgi:D-cysteine desulfhydrase
MKIDYPPRLQLAHLPTPIQKLPRLSAEVGREIHIWRDDLTGFVESGNKVRKLEFLLAHALESGANRIITAGGVQSNHTRATSFLARRLGLKVALVVREPKTGGIPEPTGNFLLNQIAGAHMHFVSYADYKAQGGTYTPFLESVAADYRRRGDTSYVIGEGGSVPHGCLGYLRAVEEMLPSLGEFDALFFADGSGGTHAGLHLAYELFGLSTRKLWAVNVCDSAEYFEKRVGDLIETTAHQFNLPSRERHVQVLDGHFGAGYGIASDADIAFYVQLARQEGVLLDPTYTGKAFRGMLAEIRKSPDRFGSKILFLHTGGAFATFAFQAQFARALADI